MESNSIIMKCIFLVSCYSLTAAILDVTLVIDDIIPRYNENATIKCVGNETYFNSFPFAVETDIGTGINIPERHIYGSIDPEEWPGKQITLLDSSGPLKYGYYSCTASSNSTGETTKITGLLMSENALVFPTSVTYRTSVGKPVTLTVRQARRRRINDLFWFRFTESGTPKKAAQASLRITIPDPKKSKSGPYVMFYPARDDFTRIFQQGMTRLLVRGCSVDKFGESCDLECPLCENGGVCDDKNGTCICPPGFMGNLCEVGCGPNKFGASCQYNCSDLDDEDSSGCKAKMFCLVDPYGCSCATGFGGTICSIDCPRGTYGHSCALPCHCNENECDPFTGSCAKGCSEGWTGVNCQKPCENGTYGANCNETCGICSKEDDCDRFTGHCTEAQITINSDLWSISVPENATSLCQFSYQPPLCKTTCKVGSWGLDCLEECHCYNNKSCEVDSGICPPDEDSEDENVLCDPGWQGGRCNETCDEGFYGKHCSLECGNCFEAAPCHHITGDCVELEGKCEPGYIKKKCVDFCGDGYFGEDCSETCNCANGTTCDPIHGTCDGFCQAGWTGSNCLEPCPSGTYGLNCTQKCGHCKPVEGQVLCDQTFGNCPNGCTKAWAGEFCRRGILCAQNPCFNNGECRQSGDFYSCHCSLPYSGSHCENMDPPCFSKPCLNNGTCTEISDTDFACNCLKNFTGKQCERNIEEDKTNIADNVGGGESDDTSGSGSAVPVVVSGLIIFGLAIAAAIFLFKHKSSNGSITPAATKPTDDPPKHINKTPGKPQRKTMSNTNSNSDPDNKKATEANAETPQNHSASPINSNVKGESVKEQGSPLQSEITFSEKSFSSNKDSIAHDTPKNHECQDNDNGTKDDESKTEDSSSGCTSSLATQEKLSVFSVNENDDVWKCSPFADKTTEPLAKPPTPPNGSAKTPLNSITLSSGCGNRKVRRRSKQLRFNKDTLNRLSEISMHNFYNNSNNAIPKENDPTLKNNSSSPRVSKLSYRGCALDPWNTNPAQRNPQGTPVYGVSRKDSTLLITSPRDADEEFEMESRKGSIMERGQLNKSLSLATN